MTRPTKLLVLISDIHGGSTQSLLPPGFENHEGNPIGQNAVQRWLWSCWLAAQKFADEVTGDDPFALLINGDAVEGNHHRTTQVISPEIGDHIRCAEQVLEHFTKRAARTFVVRGTECHTGDAEKAIGKALGAERHPATGAHAADAWDLEIMGVRINARHHCSATSRRWLESGEYSRFLINEQAEAIRNGERPPEICIRSHRHRGGHFLDGGGLALVTPAWQALTRHAHKVVPSARTQPGIQILDWRNRGHGELPEVHWRSYKAPAASAVNICP